jgi:enoyl-CoA hydratase
MLNTTEHDGILVVEMDHGKVNALDLELLRALIDAFAAAASTQPIVITGAGRAFSAGVDLRRIVEDGSAYTTQFLDALSECFLAIYGHPGPVVAAINGPAIAGGCVIAAACDRRLISRGPIGLAELAVGVAFPTSALEIMRGLVGHRTHDLVLSARTLDAEAALAIGLVDELTTPDTLLERGIEQARAWQALPPGVFAHTKHQIQRPVRERIAARAAEDDLVMTQLWASSQVHSAIAQYLTTLAQRRS